MKKLSNVQGEEALDLLADLIEPASEIFTDKEIAKLYKADKKGAAIAQAIKAHKKAVLTILALLEGEDPATYKPGLFALPAKLLQLLNDPELTQLFQSQVQDETSSGPVTANTEDEKQ